MRSAFPPLACLLAALTVSNLASAQATPGSTTRPTTTPSPVISVADGGAVDPFAPSPGRRATVLLFVADTCPISNSYAPEVARLHETYAPRGIAFYLVYADPDLKAEDARKHHAEYAFPCPALLDPRHDLVRRAGATVTPQAAVFLPDGQRVYLGRIDDRAIAYAKSRVVATQHDLRDVLESIANDRPVTPRTNKSIGCAIPELPRNKD